MIGPDAVIRKYFGTHFPHKDSSCVTNPCGECSVHAVQSKVLWCNGISDGHKVVLIGHRAFFGSERCRSPLLRALANSPHYRGDIGWEVES